MHTKQQSFDGSTTNFLQNSELSSQTKEFLNIRTPEQTSNYMDLPKSNGSFFHQLSPPGSSSSAHSRSGKRKKSSKLKFRKNLSKLFGVSFQYDGENDDLNNETGPSYSKEYVEEEIQKLDEPEVCEQNTFLNTIQNQRRQCFKSEKITDCSTIPISRLFLLVHPEETQIFNFEKQLVRDQEESSPLLNIWNAIWKSSSALNSDGDNTLDPKSPTKVFKEGLVHDTYSLDLLFRKMRPKFKECELDQSKGLEVHLLQEGLKTNEKDFLGTFVFKVDFAVVESKPYKLWALLTNMSLDDQFLESIPAIDEEMDNDTLCILKSRIGGISIMTHKKRGVWIIKFWIKPTGQVSVIKNIARTHGYSAIDKKKTESEHDNDVKAVFASICHFLAENTSDKFHPYIKRDSIFIDYHLGGHVWCTHDFGNNILEE